MKKYELTNDTLHVAYGVKVYRIRALKDFGGVKKGQLGGYVQSEDNLAHTGESWIYDKAVAWQKARVMENAIIRHNASVRGESIVSKQSVIENNAQISEQAIISDYAVVKDWAIIGNKAVIKGSAVISDHAIVEGKALIDKNSQVGGFTRVSDNAIISLESSALFLTNKAHINHDAYILSKNDILTIGPLGHDMVTLTAYNTVRKGIYISNGKIISMPIDGFMRYVGCTYQGDFYAKQYLYAIACIKHIFSLSEE